jgi:hypothetical protein
MKNLLKTFERVFVYYFAAMGLSLLISVLLNIPIKILMGDKFSSLTSFYISILPLILSLFVLFCVDGYKTKQFEFKLFLFSEIILLILLAVVVYFIGRAVYISGPTDYLARHIIYKVNHTVINGKALLNNYCMGLMIFAYLLLYSPLMLIAEYTGTRIRDKSFAKYKRNKTV